MALNLLVWLYISWICLAWGNIFIRLSGRKSVEDSTSPWVSCFAGLAIICILSLWLSLFLPAGWLMHIILLLPALIFQCTATARKMTAYQVRNLFKGYNFLTVLMAAGCLLMILLISSHYIIHPDTLSYHTKAIQWIEHYKVIPGLVHLDIRLGLQNGWLIAQAVFRFDFVSANNFLFLNGCVVTWFLLYVIAQLKNSRSLAWLALLAFVLLSWTQVRLSAASASADFIVAIYIWGTFRFFLSGARNNKHPDYWLAILFSCAAVTAKLSGIVILLIPLSIFILLARKHFNLMPVIVAMLVIAICPLIIRNVIATGYPLYPTRIGDVFTVDWKASQDYVRMIDEYITAYARTMNVEYKTAHDIIALPFDQWVPIWWSTLAWTDKGLLAIVGILLLANCFSLKNLSKLSLAERIVLGISLTGSIIWFLKAPDPRFGTCFLIPLIYSLGTAVTDLVRIPVHSLLYKAGMLTANFCILAFIIFRLANYFEIRQIIIPMGVKNTAYSSIICQGVKLYKGNTPESGFIPFPSTQYDCNRFVLRGSTIGEGFRKK